jgi:hypothetical protein
MPLPYDICVMVPCNPALLPLHQRERGVVARLQLPDDIAPFYLTISIIAASSPPAIEPGPILPAQPINFLFAGRAYGVAFTMWPVVDIASADRLEWPPFPFFVAQTAA